MFSRSLSFQEDQQQGKIMKRELMETPTMQEEDEIETWLYGPSEKNYPQPQQNLNLLQNEKGQSVNSADDDARTPIAQTESSYLLFLARENGNLYIYSVPELRLVYMVCNIYLDRSDDFFKDFYSFLGTKIQPNP
jgi:hypothetical protein